MVTSACTMRPPVPSTGSSMTTLLEVMPLRDWLDTDWEMGGSTCTGPSLQQAGWAGTPACQLWQRLVMQGAAAHNAACAADVSGCKPHEARVDGDAAASACMPSTGCTVKALLQHHTAAGRLRSYSISHAGPALAGWARMMSHCSSVSCLATAIAAHLARNLLLLLILAAALDCAAWLSWAIWATCMGATAAWFTHTLSGQLQSEHALQCHAL